VRRLLSATVFGLLACAIPAAANPLTESPRLWATINICDTALHPNGVGVRVSMPGSGRSKERMFVRIRLDYWDGVALRWEPMESGGDSGWLTLGSGGYLRRETGRTFAIDPPPAGQSFRFRGRAAYQWRLGRKVVRKAYKQTAKRPVAVRDADPKGFSAAECTVASP